MLCRTSVSDTTHWLYGDPQRSSTVGATVHIDYSRDLSGSEWAPNTPRLLLYYKNLEPLKPFFSSGNIQSWHVSPGCDSISLTRPALGVCLPASLRVSRRSCRSRSGWQRSSSSGKDRGPRQCRSCCQDLTSAKQGGEELREVTVLAKPQSRHVGGGSVVVERL